MSVRARSCERKTQFFNSATYNFESHSEPFWYVYDLLWQSKETMFHFLNFELAETKGEQFSKDCKENSKCPNIKSRFDKSKAKRVIGDFLIFNFVFDIRYQIFLANTRLYSWQ